MSYQYQVPPPVYPVVDNSAASYPAPAASQVGVAGPPSPPPGPGSWTLGLSWGALALSGSYGTASGAAKTFYGSTAAEALTAAGEALSTVITTVGNTAVQVLTTEIATVAGVSVTVGAAAAVAATVIAAVGVCAFLWNWFNQPPRRH